MITPSKIVFSFLITCFLFPFNTKGQDKTEDYNRMFTWGINKNTSGGIIGGFIFKRSQRIKERIFRTYGLEIMNVTHSQESIRRSYSGVSFIYGKSNYLYVFRPQYGYDFLLFDKWDRQGVEIKGVTAAGLSIGLQVPYYIERISDGSFQRTVHEQYDPYNPNHSFSNIVRPGYLFEGLPQADLQLGGNVKVGLNFEIGTRKSQVIGFETGFLLDAYINAITLMPTAEKVGVFPTFYGTLFYGVKR